MCGTIGVYSSFNVHSGIELGMQPQELPFLKLDISYATSTKSIEFTKYQCLVYKVHNQFKKSSTYVSAIAAHWKWNSDFNKKTNQRNDSGSLQVSLPWPLIVYSAGNIGLFKKKCDFGPEK